MNKFIYTSKYAKFNPTTNKKETFEETIDRVFNMHIIHLNNNYPHALEDDKFMKMFSECWDLCKQGKIYGSQRALQFGGEPILKTNAKLYNCAYSYCNRPDFFSETLWVLLCGCGVGFSVHTDHVKSLPSIISSHSVCTKPYIIDDSIEGWSYAIKALTEYYFGSINTRPIFDYSKIRPKGAPISSGFVAPGPDGLRNAIEKVSKIFDECLGRKLKTIEAYSITCHLSDAVLSGGLRRSALSCLFDPNDEDMSNAKTGDWFVKNPHFGRSNNSIMITRDDSNKEIFFNNFDKAKSFGEPGFAFINDIWEGFNPCFEIGMRPMFIKKGTIFTGWQFCNLTTLSAKDIESESDFFRSVASLAFLGTLQASYNNFDFLGEITNKIVKADSLLGCSISGILSKPDILNNGNLKIAARLVNLVNTEIASILGINPATRTTTIKPE